MPTATVLMARRLLPLLPLLTLAKDCEGTEQCSRNAGNNLLQFVSRVKQQENSSQLSCSPFTTWPEVDQKDGELIVCFMAADSARPESLIHVIRPTLPSPREDCHVQSLRPVLCASFGHRCVAAAEEENENCAVKTSPAEEITGTSDMLCTCEKAVPVDCFQSLEGVPVDEGGSVGMVKTGSQSTCEEEFLEEWLGQPSASTGATGETGFVREGKDIIKNIKNTLRPDTIGLQECDEPSQIASGTVAPGGEEASEFKGAQGIMKRNGRFRASSSGSRDLEAAGKWGTRYVTWATWADDASGKSFWHFNTHWCVHSGRGRTCNEEVRYRGAINMVDAIRSIAGDAPVVVTGDFNARIDEKGPKHFLQSGFQLAVNDWVDCIFYSHHWSLLSSGTGSKSGSDHNPVYAELLLK
ncbi:unnamed protein product [Durusdinium trenchii]|uniref:Endonuclease/exonuclease/phosphatase domain-containing protein n=1 Tax=Durusdinium trenchii TaxID=1381693 RepID=A0ABP0R070_9DINO